MKVTVFYVGSSLLAPLKQAERDINRQHGLDLSIAAYNFGAPLADAEWNLIEEDLSSSDLVFVMHVMDGENAARLIASLDRHQQRLAAVVVINCMPALMRKTRMGRLDIARLTGSAANKNGAGNRGKGLGLLSSAGSWVGRQVRRGKKESNGHGQYLKLVDKLPGILRFVPSAGGLRDVKHYLNIFCYFLQPTPTNIRSMVLYALNAYVRDERLLQVAVPSPESTPSVAIYHPDAAQVFETFEEYRRWYTTKRNLALDPESTVGLLLMRPQVVSKTTKHYDALIKAIEAESLSVIPALSTLMDNRQAVTKFFIDHIESPVSSHESTVKTKGRGPKTKDQKSNNPEGTTLRSRVSQILSLTGFSFVGGPAMNDSEAAATFLQQLNRRYHSAVSLDTQSIDSWLNSQTGLNPVQAGMQIAIPEIDGATEPFIYGGLPASGVEPVALEERCIRLARRLKRWNRLRTAPRSEIKLALTLFCFPPNKGNIGTAADLDVFPGLWDTLQQLKREGYTVEIPATPDELRERIIYGNSSDFESAANVAYRMSAEEYRRLCPYVDEVEIEWGAPPGRINSFDDELLVQGVHLGNIFIGVQPTFGYEGDPMRLLMARSGAPHHGFMAFYAYVAKVLNADAVVHVGTHGALEFMPGKQVGLSENCWPDRLIGELPHLYIYSVNNPSEGSIAKRRSYAELVSYLTPPIEDAGLYRELATLKDLVMAYRQSANEAEKAKLYETIVECSRNANLQADGARAGVTNSEPVLA
ncbi:MAG TPA: cobaltochelatase subunit CobN [Pyrinomonadaceae bacterium]|nr:cobaltochelatase subunit CobN [Pyrinomonadaceae bacterium]